MELDDVFRLLGNGGPLKVGRYHILLYALLIFYYSWIIGFQLMGMIFIGNVPKTYHCTPPNGFLPNETTPIIDTDGGKIELDKCHMYEVRGEVVTDNVTSCMYGWDYESLIGETSIVTDFNLVCDDTIYTKIAQSVFMAGVLAGSVTSGQLSDFFGRKVVLHAALLLKAISGIAMALVWNYNVLVLLWFLVGVFNQALQISTYVMISEMFSPEVRTMAMPLASLTWGVAVTTMTPVALLLPNWRHYQIFISALCLIGIPLWWLTPESARWLISHGRLEEAEEILQKMAKFNGVDAPKSFLSEEAEFPLTKQNGKDVEEPGEGTDQNEPACSQSIESESKRKTDKDSQHKGKGHHQQLSLYDVFKTPVLLRILLIMVFCWFTNSIIYYALSLNSITLSGNKYLNVFLTCVVELPSGVIMLIALKWIGRRPSLGISFFMVGLCCIIIGCLPKETDSGNVLVIVSTVGKFWVSWSFSMVFIFLPEIMPTPVRNVSVGACVLFARIGGIIAPFIIYLSDINRHLPFNILGASAVICAFISQILPESRNKPLPETIEDGIKRGRVALFSKCTTFKKFISEESC